MIKLIKPGQRVPHVLTAVWAYQSLCPVNCCPGAITAALGASQTSSRELLMLVIPDEVFVMTRAMSINKPDT